MHHIAVTFWIFLLNIVYYSRLSLMRLDTGSACTTPSKVDAVAQVIKSVIRHLRLLLLLVALSDVTLALVEVSTLSTTTWTTRTTGMFPISV